VTQAEPPFELVDLRSQRRGIAGIALEHLDRDRAAVHCTQQADDDLKLVASAITAIAMARQRTAAPLQPGRRHVVQHQHAVAQMALRQGGLDGPLRSAQPVERGVDLVGPHATQLQRRAQRAPRRRLVQAARRRQLRRRIEQPGDDQPQRQPGTPLQRPRQQAIELDTPRHPQRRQHVTVRQRAHDLQSLAGRHQAIAAQHGAQGLDPLGRPIRQILQRAILDLRAVAIAFPQQDGGGRASVRHHGDVHVPTISNISTNITDILRDT